METLRGKCHNVSTVEIDTNNIAKLMQMNNNNANNAKEYHTQSQHSFSRYLLKIETNCAHFFFKYRETDKLNLI